MGSYKDSINVLSLGVIILISFVTLAESDSRSSETIKFENGLYQDIIIAVDENKIPAVECPKLLELLEEVLPEFSNSLYQATGGRASIGTVSVLLPSRWNSGDCNFHNASLINPASPNFSYNSAHIQITEGHPLATSLPWTRQYKPCGQEGDSIVVPLTFLNSTSFSKLIKGHLLLHEWTKFRYGAFDEIGYFEDVAEGERQNLLTPCYMFDKQAQFTSCTTKRLPSIALDKDACSLEFLDRQNRFLEKYLIQSNTSIMSFPHLENVANYCDDSTHNSWAATKQNLYCRKSVGQVVNSHNDFKNAPNPDILQNPHPPKIKILQHASRFQTAYAFVVDNSEEMYDESKNVHAKQAIAEFVEILDVGTWVHLTVFANSVIQSSITTRPQDQVEKENFLLRIPDKFETSTITTRRLLPVIDSVIASLDAHLNLAWNVVIFSDSTISVGDMSSAIDKFHSTPHSLSIFTFESESVIISEDWLDWYRIHNTRNVMVLPYCRVNEFVGGPCNVKTSIFIVDHLLGLLNEQSESPRFIQKVGQIVISNSAGERVNFPLNYYPSLIQRVYFFFPLAQTEWENFPTVVRLFPPGEFQPCKIQPLLKYGGIMTFDECAYKSGSWTLELESRIPPGIFQHHLDVFVEYHNADTDRLLVTSSLGKTDLTQGLWPDTNLTSIFVHLSLPQGNPVLSADVQLRIFYPHLVSNGQGLTPTQIITLKDDGNSNDGVDQTGNDGIYSGYLTGYSNCTPSYHITQILISTSDNTKVLESIESPNAAFLNSKLQGKCCGKVIRPKSTRPLRAPLKFQTLHLGFKTVEPWTKMTFPPGSIGLIDMMDNNDTFITIRFHSVVGDVINPLVPIQSVHACCFPTRIADSPSDIPQESDCKPDTVECGTFRPPGTQQTCVLSKQTLINTFIVSTEDTSSNLLLCVLRVFNANSEAGQVSVGHFRVELPDKLLVRSEPKCDTINDDCLPILIFWIMIGCIGLLLLVIIIIIIALICTLRRRKSQPKSPPTKTPVSAHTPPMKRENKPTYPPENSEVVQYTTVTCEGKHHDIKVEEPNVVRELFVNHAYIQNEDGDLKIIADNGKILRKPMNNMEPKEPVINHVPIPIRRTQEIAPADNMQVYKPEPRTQRVVPPAPQSRERSIKPTYQQRPQIIHQNPMLRSDSEQKLNAIPISATSPTEPNNYATISRLGRSRPLSGIGTAGHIKSPDQAKIDPHYMTPHHTTMPVRSNNMPRRDPIPSTFRSQPPPQIHPYPSSDTDSTIYDDVRRPTRFAKPPPYPAGSKLVNGNPNLQVSSFAGGRAPKSVSSAGSPPPAYPPIPPPRYDISRNIGPTPQKASVNLYSSRQIPEDEDSDEWDDGDNDYNGGVSYA